MSDALDCLLCGACCASFRVDFSEHTAHDIPLALLVLVANNGPGPGSQLGSAIGGVVVIDIDGGIGQYAAEIRHDPRMQDLHILLHTSLSGVFNQAMVKKVGADDFLAKFRPDDLAARVSERIKAVDGATA